MNPATDTVDPVEAEGAGDRPRTTRRLRVVLAGVAAVVLYLGLSLAAPRTVPRLAILPKPAEPVTKQEECNGRPKEVTEQWERSGPLWTLTIFRLGGGCPSG